MAGERAAAPPGLAGPLTDLPGVGPARAALLDRLGVRTVADLLYLLPGRYWDFTRLADPVALQPGDSCTIWGEVTATAARRVPRKNLLIWEAKVTCARGQMTLVWFYATRRTMPPPVAKGARLAAAGNVTAARHGLCMIRPLLVEMPAPPAQGSIWPVYPSTAGLSQNLLRKLVKQALPALAELGEPLPPDLLARRELLPLPQALYALHAPADMAAVERARQRLAYGEAFGLTLAIGRRRQARCVFASPYRCAADQRALTFLSGLPFRLTADQMAAVVAIRADMESGRMMQRLLHGDVGSGKTVVAMYAAVKAAENGLQTVLLAPTRIVAEQHHRRWAPVLAQLGISTSLITGAAPDTRAAATGADVIIGTHAVLNTQFARLGLVVVDEQHRFGVAQRARLTARGHPHSLYLTATPIPRSLALAICGDLDVSVIAAKPENRAAVDTRWVSPAKRPDVYRYVRQQVMNGGQAYIVCPRVEETPDEEMILAAGDGAEREEDTWPWGAEAVYRRLVQGPLHGLKVGLCHGQMPADRQERVARDFLAGTIQVLVATSIVEVGLDAPGATVMVVEQADMFGLTQLHQLRGRVGRGTAPACCLLVAAARTSAAVARLQALRQTDNGFELAEKDLLLRGPGELLGLQQSGFGHLEYVMLPGDEAILQMAGVDARTLLAADPALGQPAHRRLQEELRACFPAIEEEAPLCG